MESDNHESSSSEDEEFGQKTPPLTVYLRGILERYPDGGQILKELLQNADDAGAKNVIFMHDKTAYQTESLLSPELKDFQGPALYAYNDGVFSDEDWYNIQNPSQSGKKNEPIKTGRFGLGFNSVYHMTDLPCIMSGSRLGFLDPIQKCFGAGNPGKSCRLKSKKLRRCKDQLKPFQYEIFDVNDAVFKKGKYLATVFRFPLRRTESELSSTLYDETSVDKLFDSFKDDAEISLLYLKSVQSVSLYTKTGDGEPCLQYRVNITKDDISNVESEREKFINGCKEMLQNERDQDVLSWTDFCITTTGFKGQNSQSARYMTLNLLKVNGISSELKDLLTDEALKLLPWVSITIPFKHIEDVTCQSRGRVFCFLPLPAEESPGFPVHIHGYFGLNDNRRGIKWPDKDSSSDPQARWNKCLVNELFPDVYAKMLLNITTSLQDPGEVYRCWPGNHNTKNDIWKEGLVELAKLLEDEPILYSEVKGGKWLTPKDVVLNDQDDELLSNVLQKTLLQKGKSVVKVPKHVIDLLATGNIHLKAVTPQDVRNAVRDDSLDWLTKEERLLLLNFIIKDGMIGDLENIHLLPLKDETFAMFSRSLPPVYIPSAEMPSNIIPDLDHRFTADTLPQSLCSAEIGNATQLQSFSAEHVIGLLEESLPRHWIAEHESHMSWIPGENGHPEEMWLSSIWTWLCQNHRKLPMERLQNIPLLPVQDGHTLVKIRPKMLIFRSGLISHLSNQSIPDLICSFLKTLGVSVIENVLPYFVSDHPDILHLIQPATPEGVCDILAANKKIVVLKTNDLPPDDRKCFRDFFADLPQHEIDRHHSFLIMLPLFQNMSNGFVSLAHCKRMIPIDIYGIPVTHFKGTFIQWPDESSKGFLLKLKCQEVLEGDLLRMHVFPNIDEGYYSDEETLDLMDWVLSRSQYDDDVRSIKFIPTSNGTKDAPRNLFDPDDDDLRVLFTKSPIFPIEEYSKGTLRQELHRVGFRERSSITAEEFLRIASEIDSNESITHETIARAKLLFSYINNRSNLLSIDVRYGNITKPLARFLEEKKWVPVAGKEDYPDNLLWFRNTDKLYIPLEVYPDTSRMLQASIVPLVDTHNVSLAMKEAFGWQTDLDNKNFVNVKRVVSHLKNVAASFTVTSNHLMYERQLEHIYEFLNYASVEDQKAAIKSELSGLSWVWHGQGFASPNKVAFNSGGIRVNLHPYLFIVPKSMRKYELLFKAAGITDTFPGDVLCDVLESIQTVNQRSSRSQENVDEDLSLVCEILNSICSSEKQSSTRILVPIRNQEDSSTCLTLVKAEECLFVDDERLLDEYKSSECELPVVHPKVPTETGKQLGLLRLSHHVAPTENIDLGYDMEGPHETTVNAIRRNLELYQEGVDIFKELIQNADDAGATEVKFLIDWRNNNDAKTTLLNKDMQLCHGPALWAFNDAQFSDADARNICSIAAQSKKADLEKVGRFGLGFTSVYHVTDVPSIVSGPFILIFDPRTTHLRERVTPSKPGIKLDLRNTKHKGTIRSFPDQFRPFQDVFGCNVLEGAQYKHTLIRLPLRSEVELKDTTGNLLSDVVYQSKEKTHHLLKLLKESASTLLLFTQNVENISVHILEENSAPNDMKDVLQVYVTRKLQLPTRAIGRGDSVLKTERNLLKAVSKLIPPKELSIESSHQTTTEENISSSMILEIHRKDDLSKKHKVSKKKKFVYLVSSCMSKGDAFCKALSPEGRKAGLLPCGGVAALLRSGQSGPEPVTTKGQAFSFLPLEISTGLPFHVNGTFLLQPNRRQLWSRSASVTTDLTEEDFRIQWNVCLMEDVICRALLNLLQDLKILEAQYQVDARSFQTLWPTFEEAHIDFHSLTQSFYENLRHPTSEVIRNGSRWISLQSVLFLNDMPNDVAVINAAKLIIDTWSYPMNKKIVDFRDKVRGSITESGILATFEDQIYTWEKFIREIFFPTLEIENGDRDSSEESDDESDDDSDVIVKTEQRDIVVQHLLDERIGTTPTDKFDDLLQSIPCIPVAENRNDLVIPRVLVHPNQIAGKLFNASDRRFPFGAGYSTSSRLLSLEELGMANETLDWKDICERAETICIDGFDTPSFERCVILIRIIDQKLRKLKTSTDEENIDRPSEEQKERIQQAKFLPVMYDREDYPFTWFGEEMSFSSAEEILEAKCTNLSGSVKPILDEKRLGADTITNRLRQFLGIKDKEPDIADVMEQLKLIIQEWTSEETNYNVSKMSSICSDIYEYLQRKLCILVDDNKIRTNEEFQPYVDLLSNTKFLFTDGNFVSAKQVAFRFSDNCPPFLYKVPPTLTPYANLLELCGVRDDFESHDFLAVVKEMYNNNQDVPLCETDINLAHKMIHYAIDIQVHRVKESSEVPAESDEGVKKIQELLGGSGSVDQNTDSSSAEQITGSSSAYQKPGSSSADQSTGSTNADRNTGSSNADQNSDGFFAIDQHGYMRDAKSLTFNDMWWDEDDTLHMTHPKLTLHSARVLGILTARQRNTLNCSSSEGFESSFGQTESLINRLQGILRDYHHVSDVMKELLQNADDAKATEIHFVYDARVHSDEKCVDKVKWGRVQKLPALCVYNNRPFSDEDIKGIQKVGVGGKTEDKSTTGRFGIGFNAVYHLTDCPTFLTNDKKLCIFDPYVEYVPGATHRRPGKQYDCTASFKKKFPDMMTGYLGDEFTLEGSTMFRFPLRSKEVVRERNMNQKTSISENEYDDARMMELLDEFQKIARVSMFFLKHIEKISVSTITDYGNMTPMYTIRSELSDSDQILRRQELIDHVETYKDTVDAIPQITKVYDLNIFDTDGLKETWMVSQTIGSNEPFEVKDDQQQCGLKSQLPRGGVAALVHSNQPITDQNSRWHKKRRVYSFLPLPIESKLPVHVNGSFALDSSRRHLGKFSGFFAQGDGSETCLDHPWNAHLVKEVIATAYAHLINEAKRMLPDNASDISVTHVKEYYSLFPTDDYGDWNMLKQHTLQYIGEYKMEVLLVLRDADDEERHMSWHHPRSRESLAFFNDLEEGNLQANERKHLRNFLHSVQFNLVNGPLALHKAFISASVQAELVTPDEVLKHLGKHPHAIAASQFPVPLGESKYKSLDRLQAVSRYCLCGRKHAPDLHNVPLLVTNDKMVRLFSTRTPVYLTTFTDLIPERGDLFMEDMIVNLLSDAEYLKTNGFVREFRTSDLAQLLHVHLPTEWSVVDGYVDWTPGENGHPTKDWVSRIWSFVFQCGESNPSIKWPIIPTKASQLVTLSKAKTVLYVDASYWSLGEIKTILVNHLHCPILSTEDIGSSYTIVFPRYRQSKESPRDKFLKYTVAVVEKPGEVLGVIEHMIDQCSLTGTLNNQQARALLTYFQEHVDGQYHRGQLNTLKKMQIFQMSNGELSSIHGYRHLYTCDTKIPIDYEMLRSNSSCIILQPNSKLEPNRKRKVNDNDEEMKLYEHLGIRRTNEANIYMYHILPSFDKLTQENKENHMAYINSNIDRICFVENDSYFVSREHFCRRLGGIKWIPDATKNALHSASFYYNGKVAVFKEMEEPCKILPQKYDSDYWRPFLTDIGLNVSVTEDIFLDYAQEIQRGASNVISDSEREDLERKSRLLLQELTRNKGLRRNNHFLTSISSIRFIPPADVDQNLCKLFRPFVGNRDSTGKQSFTSLSESLPYTDMELAWTVTKILPSYAQVFNAKEKLIGMESEAKQGLIKQNIRNVCSKMVKRNCCDIEDQVPSETRNALRTAMTAGLKYLQEQHEQETLETDDLKDISFCLVDNSDVLVCANQIVFQMYKEDQLMLRPYLYAATKEQKANRSVLEALGAKSSPTLQQLAKVLASIKGEVGDKEMHPNERKTVSTAVKLIFTELIKRGDVTSMDDFEASNVLYLPSSKGFLKPSTQLCSADTHLKKNLPATLGVDFVVELKTCGVIDQREDTSLFALLPEELRPHNLGKSMSERPCTINKKCLARNQCPFLQSIRRCMVSEELQLAMKRLLRHELEGRQLNTEQLDGISRLKEIEKLTCFEQLNTELVDNAGHCLSERPRERMIFMIDSDSTNPDIYLHHSELPVTDCFLYRELSQVIIRICGISLDAEHFSLLREVVACGNLSTMNELLTKSDIPEYEHDEFVQKDQFVPGSPVPDKFHDLLDMNPYNRFHEQEIVACIPLSQITNAEYDEEMDTGDEFTEQRYIFARVLSEQSVRGKNRKGGMKRRYIIDAGRASQETVSATSLYKFRRFKLSSEHAQDSLEDDGLECEERNDCSTLPVNNEEDAKIWIKRAVEEALALDEGERKAALRRLRLMWHPDKNRTEKELLNTGFQILQQEIDRLENGE